MIAFLKGQVTKCFVNTYHRSVISVNFEGECFPAHHVGRFNTLQSVVSAVLLFVGNFYTMQHLLLMEISLNCKEMSVRGPERS